jgi:aminoglycoside phosphotransferase (APT) family kinase protein
MLELSADNAADYLRRQGWIGPGPARVAALGGGVSNAVLRVESADGLFVLKQSRPQLRTRDDWFSDLDRVYREQEVMEVLRPLLPPLVVPEVLHSDRANYVFAMSHAPRAAQNWKAQLLAGEVDGAVGAHAGRVLGQMHERTPRQPKLVERFADRTVFVQLRVDPFYRRVQERRPEVAAAVAPLIEELLTAREGLCHGDYSPKNILTHADGFTLVDYETAHLGEPAMDLGFFLSHLLLKACKRHVQRERYFELTRAFWRGYAAEVAYRPAAELVRRGVGHLGVCLLARIDGMSPVDYLPEEDKREAVRRLGRWLLWERPGEWEEVLRRCEAELASIAGPA